MGLNLKGKQYERLRDALTDGYRTYPDLKSMVRIELEEQLANISTPQKMPTVAEELIDWAEQNTRLDDLIRGALARRPNNESLRLFAQEVLLTSTAAPSQPLAQRFEQMFLEGVGLHDVVDWRRRMEAAERCVCRIDQKRPDGTFQTWGSGCLVAPDLILTNEHVADELRGGEGRARFDYNGEVAPVDVPIQGNWLLAESHRDELDYTLIQLAGVPPPGAGAGPRGYLTLSKAAVPVGAPLFILQYPKGDGLKVCAGAAVATADPKRLCYTTNTEPGSSGSPVLTLAWDLVALHHFADETLKRNRGIPLPLILLDLQKKGKAGLLGGGGAPVS